MRYVGRQPIDASTKARFVIKHFPYDTSLEMQFSGNNEKLCNLVWALRKSIEDLGLRQVLSPSHTKRAATMLAAERDPVRVINVAILGDDTDKATRTKIVNNQNHSKEIKEAMVDFLKHYNYGQDARYEALKEWGAAS